jgi:DNA-binding response OmpR family regulator
MAFTKIVFLGTAGLEADIFSSYMSSAGYLVQVISATDGAVSAVQKDPSAIVVISVDQTGDELLRLVRAARAGTGNKRNPIFVLTNEKGFDAGLPSVYVVTRPFRLSELVKRIQNLRHSD